MSLPLAPPVFPDAGGAPPSDDIQSPESSLSSDVPSGFGQSQLSAVQPMMFPNAMTDPLDLKRSRACEACRHLKVRCIPDPGHPDQWCKRCIRAKRRCVITLPSRRRQKKASAAENRVAELEKKIDALQANLHNPRTGNGNAHVPDKSMMSSSLSSHDNSRAEGRAMPVAGELRLPDNEELMIRQRSLSISSDSSISGSSSVVANPGNPNLYPSFMSSRPPELSDKNEYADIIDQRIVDTEMAEKAFKHYNEKMAPSLPAVVFSPEATMSEVRRTKPTLFLAILCVSIARFDHNLLPTLRNILLHTFAQRIMFSGEKSLELVQSLLVTAFWYTPPDYFEQLRFYQFIHQASIMAMDLGMNRRAKPRSKKSLIKFRDQSFGNRTFCLDPDSVEVRRTWVGCYFITVTTAASLRRPCLIRWEPYMDECLDILESSADSLPTDKSLIYFAKIANIVEEASYQFSLHDPASSIDFEDPRIQFALKAFEKRLEEWRSTVPAEFYTPLLRHYDLVTDIYVHEIGLHIDHNIDDFTPPFVAEFHPTVAVDMGTVARVNAMTICLTSIHDDLNIFLSMDVDSIHSTPSIQIARTIYAVVVLIRLYSVVSAPSAKLGHVFRLSDLKVEGYLYAVEKQLKKAANVDGGHVASRFSVLSEMLLTWFLKRKDKKPSLSKSGSSADEDPKSPRGPDVSAPVQSVGPQGSVYSEAEARPQPQRQTSSRTARTMANTFPPVQAVGNDGMTSSAWSSSQERQWNQTVASQDNRIPANTAPATTTGGLFSTEPVSTPAYAFQHHHQVNFSNHPPPQHPQQYIPPITERSPLGMLQLQQLQSGIEPFSIQPNLPVTFDQDLLPMGPMWDGMWYTQSKPQQSPENDGSGNLSGSDAIL